MIKKIKKNKRGLYDVKFIVEPTHLALDQLDEISIIGSFSNWDKKYHFKKKRSSQKFELVLKNLKLGTYEYKYVTKMKDKIKWLEVDNYKQLYKEDICTNAEGTKNGFFVI